ncbi:response regulator [Natranaerobius thermophilus]|uniref:Stage 0 sporulation protein A homolog n=1 Tax=Natranaerobius thermophilus (strain ATCC BAA-1301 / DSM 18059 / JW/NM-WN-LF) TaxID=457570 RepID=B2A7N5_NATTJ|nr:response regulator transcription factor [Natranaerobius thermophilus]ACB84337.1 two component transcriptional regulator, LuxR family [Natranaerobius thermophilus JW/NM-WN-LF]
MSKIKVMIADDQTILADSLKTIIDLEDDMEVVAVSSNGEETLEISEKLLPDIILMDIRMPKMDGVECTKKLKEKYPEIKIIILTTFDHDEYIVDALSYGASGYLLKDIDGDKLISSIRDAYNDKLLIPTSIAAKLIGKIDNRKQQPTDDHKDEPLKSQDRKESQKEINLYEELTQREIEIAQLMVAGLSNKKIAEKLFITQGTVKNYITNIYSKLGVKERTSAVLYLQKLGF